MKNALKGLALLILLFNFSLAYAHPDHHSTTIDDLPLIDVEVQNESDVFISITINSLCAPRIILQPGEFVIIKNCLRQGLIYQGSVVFYTNEKVLERHPFTGPVRPNDPWIFCKLPKNKTQCD